MAGLVFVLLVGLAAWVAPWAREDREPIAAVPSPRALEAVATIPVGPGARACSPDLGLDERATEARLETLPRNSDRPPLEITVVGVGYEARSVSPATSSADRAVVVALPRPGRDLLVELCVRNVGSVPVSLAGSADRTRSRSLTSVDGRPTGASAWITFAERGPRSFAENPSLVLSRMATFRPGFVVPALLGLLAICVVAGVPLAIALAWWRALREEEGGRHG